jgi:5-methylcytosine-specific restriction endonuclease McrA
MPEISPSRWVTTAKPRYSVPVGQHWHKPDRCKTCILCEEVKPVTEFYAYAYTTMQGKRSTRYESRCLECARARRRSEYQKTRPQQLETMRRYREATVEERRAYNKRRQELNEVKALKAFHQRLRCARMRGDGTDDEAIRAIYAEAVEVERIVACCPVFDIPEIGKKMHVDHIMPLARGGRHEASNLQILPIGLNMRKGVRCPK